MSLTNNTQRRARPALNWKWWLALSAALIFLLAWPGQQAATRQGRSDRQGPAEQPLNAGYRSPGNRHKVQVSDERLAREVEARGGRLVADYGGFKVFEVDSAAVEALGRKRGIEVRDEDNLVMLHAGAIDTAAPEAQAGRRAGGPSAGKGMHLVQFVGPVKPEWYEALLATGVRVVTYVPNNSYLVYGNQGSFQRLRNFAQTSPYVQWDGEYGPRFKVHPHIKSGSEKREPAAADEKPGRGGGSGVEKFALEKLATAQPASPAQEQEPEPPAGEFYGVQLIDDKAENAETVQLIERLQLEPTISQWDVLHYHNYVVRMTAVGVDEVSKRPDVVFIEPYVVPQKRDERQNQIIAGNLTGTAPTPGDWLAYLAARGFTQAQFTASGFAVDVGDDGLDNATTSPNHPGLYVFGDKTNASRVVYARKEGTGSGPEIRGCEGHGTLNSHVVGGYVPFAFGSGFPHADSAGFRYGLGVAPFVRLGSSVIFTPAFTSPNFPNWQSRAYNDGARISTNSWGANVAGAYTINSQSFDALVRDAQPTGAAIPAAGNQEMVIVFAAGNAGPGASSVGAPGTAKNVITVGAAENVHSHSTANGGTTATGQDGCNTTDTGANSADDIIGFSGRGPTTDGRKKPEIVAPGTHVTGGVFQNTGVLPANGQAHPCFNANSVCALPGVGNNFFPVGQQWYTTSSGTSHSTPAVSGAAALIRQHFINQGLTPPSPAMTKALLMSTARYMTGVGANDSLWSNSQGMGEVNLGTYFDLFVTPSILKEQAAINTFTASGQTRTFAGVIPDSSKPFRVTLTWSDPPGPTSGNSFVNNLDLEVTAGGNTYKGNVFSGANSATGGSADIRDNAESVFLPAGTTGTFVIKVKATNIAGDGIPNSGGALDQDFALVVYNANEVEVPVVEAAGSLLTAESCNPATGVIDPGETVTVDFSVQNVGTGDTSNLVATLQPTGGVTSTSGPQNYGVVIADGPAVSRPFTFTADSDCGGKITATIQLQDGSTDLGTVTYTFTVGTPVPSSVTGNYATGDIAVPIPDVTTVEIPLNVADVGLVSNVKARVRLNHTFDGDVDMFLVHPDGTTVELSTDNGSTGDNFGDGANNCSGNFTVFDDAATTSITAGTAPFVGAFIPEQALSTLDGKPSDGVWKLRITDDAAQDTGTVGCFQLEISRQQFYCCGVPGTPLIEAVPPATLVSECGTNGAPDPGEIVTMSFPLRNIGTDLTTDLVATLQPSGGVIPISGPQSYGALVPPGGASRNFTFAIDGSAACGSDVTATFQLQDGANNLGTVTFTIRLGTTVPATQTFSNSGAIAIPAVGTGASTGSPAAPYPSTINVSGMPGTISNVVVKLKNLSHTFPGDVDFLLVGPGGQKFIILSDVIGGTDAVNITWTLDDAAAALVPSTGTPASGTFRPTNYSTGDLFPAPAPAAPYQNPATAGAATFASVFGGATANGNWNLYVVDDASADTGSVAGGWELTITTNAPVCETTQPVNITGVSVDKPSLWPPNHKMQDVAVSYSTGTGCATCTLSVTSNEPENGTGDGDTSPDWEVAGDHLVRLRAERAGNGGGRIYTITITCTNGHNTDTETVEVYVAHNITGPNAGSAFKINSPVNVAGTFWDLLGRRHTAQWTFDGLSTSGLVTEPAANRLGAVSGTYTFRDPGVYKVRMNVTDNAGRTSWVSTQNDLEALLVVYDPSGGYTIGGGWIDSPAGAYAADRGLAGKLGFGFSSKYFKGASNPKGETQIEFKLGGMEFNAVNFDYLSISGARAQFKGFGKLNGGGAYNFILTVIDGQLPEGGGVDRFRLKITNKATGAVVYDSQPGDSDAAAPTTPVGPGGDIIIRK